MNKNEVGTLLTLLIMVAITVSGSKFVNSDMGFAFVGVSNFFVGVIYGCYLGSEMEKEDK